MERPLPDRSATERRRAQRYPLHFEFDFRAFREEGPVTTGDGITRNISSHGALVQTTVSLAVGESIEMQLKLFDIPNADLRAQLVLLGHVIRADAEFFAIRILRHGFQP